MKIENIGAHLRTAAGFARFIPEPTSRIGAGFSRVMSSVGSILGGGGTLSLDPQYQDLLNKQMELQQQMQMVTMESNVEKTRHESKMAALRNLRAQ